MPILHPIQLTKRASPPVSCPTPPRQSLAHPHPIPRAAAVESRPVHRRYLLTLASAPYPHAHANGQAHSHPMAIDIPMKNKTVKRRDFHIEKHWKYWEKMKKFNRKKINVYIYIRDSAWVLDPTRNIGYWYSLRSIKNMKMSQLIEILKKIVRSMKHIKSMKIIKIM